MLESAKSVFFLTIIILHFGLTDVIRMNDSVQGMLKTLLGKSIKTLQDYKQYNPTHGLV